ncbi:MAG TPA: PqiC family protein [Luteolibacter sp.]|jgi:uncharacterized lipoprotein YmbA|nr:PqiC family protein [Luteolibacter sp.]
MRKYFALLFASLLVCGCGGYPSYYTLTPDGPAPSGGGRAIGIGPVTLAEYIDRPNLVLQGESDPNTLLVAADHRWAGDLEQAVMRVTATNLGRRLGTGNLLMYPWQNDSEVSRQVAIDIRQFHGASDGYAVIEASYRVYALPGRSLVASKTFTDRERLESDGYQSLVAAQSKLMTRMADQIAKSMR